jgi:hypothetical protein
VFQFALIIINIVIAETEVKWYFIIFMAVTLLITWNVSCGMGGNPLMNFHHAAFQVSSLMTTTGMHFSIKTSIFNIQTGKKFVFLGIETHFLRLVHIFVV